MIAIFFSSLYCSVQSLSRVRLCNPVDCSTPGLPVHHQLPEFTQTHDHRVGDAIQPSHPLSSPSPPAFSLSQHQGLILYYSSNVFHNKISSIKTLGCTHKPNSRNLRSDSFWGTDWEGAECITGGDRITILISIPQN